MNGQSLRNQPSSDFVSVLSLANSFSLNEEDNSRVSSSISRILCCLDSSFSLSFPVPTRFRVYSMAVLSSISS
jgi:hypothetical protein